MKLHFVLSQFPRTITRGEWKEIWRWKRQAEKDCIALELIYRERIKDPTTLPDFRRELVSRLISPPLLVHERQEMTWHANNLDLGR